MANLPQEILAEIFSRMPQKSFGKCKCLSKYWLSFLSTPHFLKMCLTHFGNLIMITQTHSLHLLLFTPLIAVSRKLDLPGSWTEVIGSCNGLVLLANKQCELHLVNPVTCSMLKIPEFDLALKKTKSTMISHGFGYDSSTNDYKIVTLSFCKSIKATYVDVYSHGKGVWKRVHIANYLVFVTRDNPNATGVFVNGALHWQALSGETLSNVVIAAFDLANQVFSEISVPHQMARLMLKRLLVCGGCLSGMLKSKFIGYDGRTVWTMKEYGSLESHEEYEIPEKVDCPKCFVGEERLVFSAFDGAVFVFDLKEGKKEEFIVDGVPAHCKDMANFVSNLA